jgi:SAM-dependent methyltransferase
MDMTDFSKAMARIPAGRLLSRVHDLLVLTDPVDYAGVDQVFPMYPEQPFFLDELRRTDIRGARALEIGLGSGVLSIGTLKAGAARVDALEINPRAKLFAGFNALLNGVADGLCIRDGDRADLWAPVAGERFDFILSNPPFMPSPPGAAEHYFHSGGGGLLGMDFLERILAGLDDHLAAGGRAQFVTAAPGDAELPTALIELLERHLRGAATLVVDPLRLPFDDLAHHLPDGLPAATMAAATRQLQDQGISHEYLCVVHYAADAPRGLSVEQCAAHPAWDQPLAEGR